MAQEEKEYQEYGRHFREVFLDLWFDRSRSSYRKAYILYDGAGSDMVNHLLATNTPLFDSIFDEAEADFREKYPDEVADEGF